jgi:hypothetical protein
MDLDMHAIRPLVPITVALAHCLLCPNSSSGPFTNGSFESLAGIQLPLNQAIDLQSGDTRLLGWTISGGGHVTVIHGQEPNFGLDFSPIDGTNQLAFNSGNTPAGTFITQAFDTIVGEDYVVRFYVGQQGAEPTNLSLTASVTATDGTLLAQYKAVPPPHGFGSQQSFFFTATSATTTLELLDTSAGTIGADLDLDDVVVAVRETTLNIQVSQVQICWDSVSNRVYQVQYRSTATTNQWVNLGNPVVANGNTACVLDSTVGQEQRYYQVVKTP